MYDIPTLKKIAGQNHCLDLLESRARTQHIRVLRSMWVNASCLEGLGNCTAIVREQIDIALAQLGAEPEGLRRDRHYSAWAWHDEPSIDQMNRDDKEEGHKRYVAWLKDPYAYG